MVMQHSYFLFFFGLCSSAVGLWDSTIGVGGLLVAAEDWVMIHRSTVVDRHRRGRGSHNEIISRVSEPGLPCLPVCQQPNYAGLPYIPAYPVRLKVRTYFWTVHYLKVSISTCTNNAVKYLLFRIPYVGQPHDAPILRTSYQQSNRFASFGSFCFDLMLRSEQHIKISLDRSEVW